MVLSQRLVDKYILLKRLDHQIALLSQAADTTKNVRFAFILTLVQYVVDGAPSTYSGK